MGSSGCSHRSSSIWIRCREPWPTGWRIIRWLGETDDTAESLNQSAYGTSEREDSDMRTFIQDYFDHNKELTPDSLYWGVPSYRVINEAKGEFSKQQVLDGRRRPKPLLASKKYGNMWW